MSAEKPIFWDFVLINEEGNIIGLKPDSPAEMQAAFEAWMKEYDDALQNGEKI